MLFTTISNCSNVFCINGQNDLLHWIKHLYICSIIQLCLNLGNMSKSRDLLKPSFVYSTHIQPFQTDFGVLQWHHLNLYIHTHMHEIFWRIFQFSALCSKFLALQCIFYCTILPPSTCPMVKQNLLFSPSAKIASVEMYVNPVVFSHFGPAFWSFSKPDD